MNFSLLFSIRSKTNITYGFDHGPADAGRFREKSPVDFLALLLCAVRTAASRITINQLLCYYKYARVPFICNNESCTRARADNGISNTAAFFIRNVSNLIHPVSV